MRVPGRVGDDEAEFAGEPFGDAQAVRAERGERARRAAELQQAGFIARALQPAFGARQRGGIAGGF